MKKKSIKSLKLNKKSISKLQISVFGGAEIPTPSNNCVDITTVVRVSHGWNTCKTTPCVAGTSCEDEFEDR